MKADNELAISLPVLFKSIFNVFAREILPVDAFWSWQRFIYEEFKDILKENRQGFGGRSQDFFRDTPGTILQIPTPPPSPPPHPPLPEKKKNSLICKPKISFFRIWNVPTYKILCRVFGPID